MALRFTAAAGLLAALALFGAAPAPALAQDRPEDVQRIATAFVEAYGTLDLDTLAALAAEDIVVVDESAPSGDWGGPYRFNGRDAWLEGMAGFARDGGLIDMRQEHDQSWQSGEKMIFIGRVDARYRAEAGGVVHVRGRIVTIITVRDGKVVRHEDVADYNGFEFLRVPDETP